MLKLFVICISCAVVFGDSHGIMSSPTPSPTSSSKSTTAPNQSNSRMLSVHSLASTHGKQTTSSLKSSHPATPSSVVTSTAKASTASAKSTISPSSTIAPKPTSSPTLKPTTTPKPTTLPPTYGNFSLEENGRFCLLAEFVAKITVEYKTKSNVTKTGTVVQHLDGTTNVNVTGDCGIGKDSSSLVLSWPKENPLYELTMKFEKLPAVSANSNKTKWEISDITFIATVEDNHAFLNFSGNTTNVISFYNGSKDFHTTELGSYYMCEAVKSIHLKNGWGDEFKVDSSFSHLKLEPFTNSTVNSFGNGSYTECPQDRPKSSPSPSPTSSKNNDIVPIAVGCALAGLVLIVLIAYVIGRRKSHSGYEKV
mmetsp:Transcript_36836/g.58410  ORF Transcript_36836/g.58410 Transcript_36836/m.58410 type:complete len:366 (-) Transcript_36836:2174-3271(-)